MSEDWFFRERLHMAVQDGDLEEVKKLVYAGHDLDVFDDISNTPLHYAAESENIEIARYLLASGADPNANEEAKIGNTPLGQVAGNCSYEIAHLLIEAGANPTIPGWMQLTALHHASQRKKKEGQRVYDLLLRTAKKKFADKI